MKIFRTTGGLYINLDKVVSAVRIPVGGVVHSVVLAFDFTMPYYEDGEVIGMQVYEMTVTGQDAEALNMYLEDVAKESSDDTRFHSPPTQPGSLGGE